MPSLSDYETLVRIGPGTPMGGLMREYWLPALKSSELVAGGAPVRLMLLGEKLIAFREPSGQVGVMDHRCPHRCASLFFGRNETGGMRCAYHGWKFDTNGTCTDMPNVPPHLRHPEKIRVTSYRALERNGVVWVYMGSRAQVPELPMLEVLGLPADEVHVIFVQRECNWFQAAEGDMDTSHAGFLHAGGVAAADIAPGDDRFMLIDRAPEYHVAETDWGTMYAAYRPADPGNTYWRFSHFLFPFWLMPPGGSFYDHISARATVPMDDTHTMFVIFAWKKNPPPLPLLKDGSPMPGATIAFDVLPNTTDWYGRWKLRANAGNDYLIDRDAQHNGNFSGITGVHLQDQALTESQGAIADRAREQLVVSDHMITRTRRRLLLAARAHADAEVVPPGVDTPGIYRGARGGDCVAPSDVGWMAAYADQIRGSLNPTGRLQLAV